MSQTLTIAEFANRLGVSRMTLHRMRSAGEVPPPIKTTRRFVRWSMTAVTTWEELGCHRRSRRVFLCFGQLKLQICYFGNKRFHKLPQIGDNVILAGHDRRLQYRSKSVTTDFNTVNGYDLPAHVRDTAPTMTRQLIRSVVITSTYVVPE